MAKNYWANWKRFDTVINFSNFGTFILRRSGVIGIFFYFVLLTDHLITVKKRGGGMVVPQMQFYECPRRMTTIVNKSPIYTCYFLHLLFCSCFTFNLLHRKKCEVGVDRKLDQQSWFTDEFIIFVQTSI